MSFRRADEVRDTLVFVASKGLMTMTYREAPLHWLRSPLARRRGECEPRLVAPAVMRPTLSSLVLLMATPGGRSQATRTETGHVTGTRPTDGIGSGRRSRRLGGDGAGNSRTAEDDSNDDPIDPDDLHHLVVEHSDAVYRLALSIVRDASLAEDVAQEALVKAWLALPTFRGEASLRSWLLRITHNTAISTLRRRRAVVLDPQDLPESHNKVERSVESQVQSQIVMDEFVVALDTLDELSRSIVVLRELEGLSYEEISQVLRVPMPTVKTRLLRARRRLGNVLKDWA